MANLILRSLVCCNRLFPESFMPSTSRRPSQQSPTEPEGETGTQSRACGACFKNLDDQLEW